MVVDRFTFTECHTPHPQWSENIKEMNVAPNKIKTTFSNHFNKVSWNRIIAFVKMWTTKGIKKTTVRNIQKTQKKRTIRYTLET